MGKLEKINAEIKKKEGEIAELKKQFKLSITTDIDEDWAGAYVSKVQTEVSIDNYLGRKGISLYRTYFGEFKKQYDERDNVGWLVAHFEVHTLQAMFDFLKDMGIVE